MALTQQGDYFLEDTVEGALMIAQKWQASKGDPLYGAVLVAHKWRRDQEERKRETASKTDNVVNPYLVVS